MAIPGPGLSLIPADGAARTAVAQQLACWARLANGLTDPRIRFLSCCKAGYFYIPPEVCTAGYGAIPFTSRGDAITCDATETEQHDLTILASDVTPIDPVTCSTEGIALATPVIATATPGDTQVTLAWSAVPGAATYATRYKTPAAGSWTTGPTTTAPDVDVAVTSLTNGQAYLFQVQALSPDYTDSQWSVSVTATPAAP